ncbi:hypothetical protein Tco_0707258 [Tanacetum coccineum]|uniref:HMA domain-containing protein n=1 Tax=Tanacetum coccineum TaxID=301880 RepID=A0ABQ4YAL2_9ASTR
MVAFEHNEEESEPEKSKKLAKVPTTLASIESLTFPLVHEVVLLADYRCTMCQDRVADIVSRLNEKTTLAEDMAAFEHNEEESEPEKSKKLAKVPTTLASIESLTFPLVHEVVLLADYRCTMCQDRVADIVSRLNGKCYAFVRFIKVDNVDRLVGNLCTLWIGRMHLHANVERFERALLQKPRPPQHPRLNFTNASSFVSAVKGNSVGSGPALVLDDSCVVKRDLEKFVMEEGGLWVMVELDTLKAKNNFMEHVGVASWFNRLFARFCQVAEHQFSLLLTPLCCDDTHEVTSRVSALTGCDRLVSEPLVIEK